MRRQTYRTLDEQQGKLSPAEERFERGRRTVGLVAGPLLFPLLLVAPSTWKASSRPWPRSSAWVTWWITEAIPIPITGVVGLA